MTNAAPKRFLSIRLTDAEFKDVHRRLEHSTCNSLTEYVKKLVTAKPVTTRVRNESQDQLLQEIVNVKNKFDELIDIAERSNNQTLLAEITEMKSILKEIAKKCLQ